MDRSKKEDADICPVCKFELSREPLHSIVHESVLNGLSFPSNDEIPDQIDKNGTILHGISTSIICLAGQDGLQILLVGPVGRKSTRRRIAALAELGARECGENYPYLKTDEIYTTKVNAQRRTDPVFGPHAVVLNKNEVAIGLMIACRINMQELGSEVEIGVPVTIRPLSWNRQTAWCINHIWIAANYRRQGHATRMVRTLADWVKLPVEELYWQTPLSLPLQKLANHLCPRGYRMRAIKANALRD